MPPVLLVLLGLAALVGGAELIVRRGSSLAGRLGISPILVGLTIVSLGTSTPELAVGINAARAGSAGLAIGNIVGTNIVNLLLILGSSALIRPVLLPRRTMRIDLPAMVGAAVLLVVLSLDGSLTRAEGVLLVVLGLLFTLALARSGRKESTALQEEYQDEFQVRDTGARGRGIMLDSIVLLVGIAVVVLGADLLVTGGVELARAVGVEDAIIGLTIVAIGTSAPELVTTIISTIRGDPDIALGNLLGSSVYNILLILGVTMVVSPQAIAVPPDVLRIDMVLMLVAVLACVPAFATGWRVSRVEGGIFVAAYLVYLGYLLAVRT